MYKYVIFDIDGTMLDTEKAIICALQKLLKEEKNISYKKEDLYFVLGIPGHEAIKLLNATDIEQVNYKWNNHIKEYLQYVQLFPDIEKTIICLKNSGIKTGIVTSKTKREYEADFVPFCLNHYFDHVVCADDTIKHKPNPEPLLKCLELASILPEEAIYIGDTIYDMKCALSAGVDFGLALWGTKDKKIDCMYKFSNPQEIITMLSTTTKNNLIN